MNNPLVIKDDSDAQSQQMQARPLFDVKKKRQIKEEEKKVEQNLKAKVLSDARSHIWGPFIENLTRLSFDIQRTRDIKQKLQAKVYFAMQVHSPEDFFNFQHIMSQDNQCFFPPIGQLKVALTECQNLEVLQYRKGPTENDTYTFVVDFQQKLGYAIGQKKFFELRKKFEQCFINCFYHVIGIEPAHRHIHNDKFKTPRHGSIDNIINRLNLVTAHRVSICAESVMESEATEFKSDHSKTIHWGQGISGCAQSFKDQFNKIKEDVLLKVYGTCFATTSNPVKREFQIHKTETMVMLGGNYVTQVKTGLENLDNQKLQICKTGLVDINALTRAITDDIINVWNACPGSGDCLMDISKISNLIQLPQLTQECKSQMLQAQHTRGNLNSLTGQEPISLNTLPVVYMNNFAHTQNMYQYDWTPLTVGPMYTLNSFHTLSLIGEVLLKNLVINSDRKANIIIHGEHGSGKTTLVKMVEQHFGGHAATGDFSRFQESSMKNASILIQEEIAQPDKLSQEKISHMKTSFDLQCKKRIDEKYIAVKAGLHYVPWLITSNHDFINAFKVLDDPVKRKDGEAIGSRFISVNWRIDGEMHTSSVGSPDCNNIKLYDSLGMYMIPLIMFRMKPEANYYTTDSIQRLMIQNLVQIMEDKFLSRMVSDDMIFDAMFVRTSLTHAELDQAKERMQEIIGKTIEEFKEQFKGVNLETIKNWNLMKLIEQMVGCTIFSIKSIQKFFELYTMFKKHATNFKVPQQQALDQTIFLIQTKVKHDKIKNQLLAAISDLYAPSESDSEI